MSQFIIFSIKSLNVNSDDEWKGESSQSTVHCKSNQLKSRLENHIHLVCLTLFCLFLPHVYKLQDGHIEYKRQLHNCSTSRLEKLKTQMSYRLDEGNGACMYRIGVEDNGNHSLTDYKDCAETARVLELLARSLNAVVLERKMIQNEVVRSPEDGTALKGPEGQAIESLEPSLLGDGREAPTAYSQHDEHEHRLEEQKRDNELAEMFKNQPTIDKSSGTFTRCELTIQRVETHLLDLSPLSVANVARGDGANDGVQNGGTATNGHDAAVSNELGTATNKKEHDSSEHCQNLSVSETLSSRNIRVAVVGNVDAGKSTMIGTLTSSCLDDGRGSSRTSIMKHRHEIESGRTSTASTHLMGFRSTGEAIAGREALRNRRKSEDEVAKESYRIVTLMDLAGHEKYLKTT